MSENRNISLPGSGTSTDPYQITKAEDFRFMDNTSDHFRLMNEIDLKNEPWTPIRRFGGNFHGGGVKIRNLKIYLPDESQVGFFGDSWGTIRFVELENVDITGRTQVGGIVGVGSSIRIDSCHVTGTGQIKGVNSVGGIIGNLEVGTIDGCKIEVAVTGVDSVGGILGSYGGSSVVFNELIVNTTVTGDTRVGGLLGSAWRDGSFETSDTTVRGRVQGNSMVGGFFGQITADASTSLLSIVVRSTFMFADVSGDSIIGELQNVRAVLQDVGIGLERPLLP